MEDLAVGRVIQEALATRRYGFDVERAIYLTVMHRLFAPGSDRRRNAGANPIGCRAPKGWICTISTAMAFLGEALEDQTRDAGAQHSPLY